MENFLLSFVSDPLSVYLDPGSFLHVVVYRNMATRWLMKIWSSIRSDVSLSGFYRTADIVSFGIIQESVSLSTSLVIVMFQGDFVAELVLSEDLIKNEAYLKVCIRNSIMWGVE